MKVEKIESYPSLTIGKTLLKRHKSLSKRF